MCLQYTLLFPGNLDPSSLTPGDPIVLLVCGFRRRDSLLAWRELFANLYELKSRIWFWGNTTTLSEFIWYIDLTDFCQISPDYPRNNGKFVAWHPFAQHDQHIFCYSNFRCRYLDKQSEYRKSVTHFCWLMPCEWDCAACLCCGVWYPIN